MMLDKLKALYARYVDFGFTRRDAVRVAYAAAFAFVATFGPLATGLANFKNLQEARAAALALDPDGDRRRAVRGEERVLT